MWNVYYIKTLSIKINDRIKLMYLINNKHNKKN